MGGDLKVYLNKLKIWRLCGSSTTITYMVNTVVSLRLTFCMYERNISDAHYKDNTLLNELTKCMCMFFFSCQYLSIKKKKQSFQSGICIP